MEILEFPPRNYPMPKISSTDQLLIVAQDMNEVFKHPHPDVSFSTIEYDTITALTTLLAIFTKQINKNPLQATTTAPKAAKNKKTSSSGPTSTHIPSQV